MRVLSIPPKNNFTGRLFGALDPSRGFAGTAKPDTSPFSEKRTTYRSAHPALLVLLLCLILAAALPVPAAFADGETGISLKVSKGEQVYFGNIPWRVLYGGTGNNDDPPVTQVGSALLISNNILGVTGFKQNESDGNAWSESRAQSWCTDYYTNWPAEIEKNAILATTVTETNNADEYYYHGGYHNNYYYKAASLNGEHFFFLSAKEADELFTEDSDRIATGAGASDWWLRSPYAEFNLRAGLVDANGSVNHGNVIGIYGVRPAFNLNPASFLFSSVIPNSSQYKLTLKDPNLTISVSDASKSGNIVTVPCTISGSYDRIWLVMPKKEWSDAKGWGGGAILDHSEVVTLSNGSVTFTMPTGYNTTWKTYLIAEKVNEGNLTNYGSEPVWITIPKSDQTVIPPAAVSPLTYSGDPQTLITAAVVTDGNTVAGSISYSLDNTNWSTDLPQGTDAKTYTVYYKVAGNGNYNDFTGPSPVSVTIDPADPEKPFGLTAKYGQTLADVELPAGWAWTDGSASVGDAGTKTFKANYTSDDPNYNSLTDADLAVTVEPVDPEPPTGLTAKYGQTLADVELPSGWSWVDSSESVGDAGTKTFKANYTSDDPNYNSLSNVDLTVTVKPADTPEPTRECRCFRGRCGGCRLPATGFSAVRPAALPEQPKVLSYEPLRMRIMIPSLDVDQELVRVPLSGDTWPVEWLGDRAGLLSGTGLPGQGLSVVAAHNTLNDTEFGPFARLAMMEVNDLITVTDRNGGLSLFRVYANELLDADGADALLTIAGRAENTLVLLTCENESAEGGYLSRRVVFAEPVR